MALLPLIRHPATTGIPAARALAYAPTTNFSGQTLTLQLDPTLINGLGQWAIIYSPVALTGYNGATWSWTTTPTFTVTSVTVTAAGSGTGITVNGISYYAVLVTVA